MPAIPILIVEDELNDRLRMYNLINELVETNQIPDVRLLPAFDAPFDLSELKKLARSGVYPAAAIDLDLDKKGRGLELIKLVQGASNAMVAAYTAKATEHHKQLIPVVDDLLDKEDREDVLKSGIVNFINKVKLEFNYDIEVNVGVALSKAFPFGMPPRLEKSGYDNWELCLRRIFKGAKNDITYDIC